MCVYRLYIVRLLKSYPPGKYTHIYFLCLSVHMYVYRLGMDMKSMER